MTVQDRVLTERRVPLQRSLGGAVGQTVGVRSDSGHYSTADVEAGIVTALQGSTGWQATTHLVLSNMRVLTVTIGASEPVIPGTNIPLYRVSALFDGGMTVREVMEDFPSLTEAQIVNARNYARRYPNFGKPYPQKSLKRLLRNSGFAQLEQAMRKGKKRS
jgi:uncharacterized protein (DUF433 family)